MRCAWNRGYQEYDCERHPRPTDIPSVRLRKAPVSVYELERCSVDSLTLLLLTTVYPWMTAACRNVPLPSRGMIYHLPPRTWALRTICRAWFIPFGIHLHSGRLGGDGDYHPAESPDGDNAGSCIVCCMDEGVPRIPDSIGSYSTDGLLTTSIRCH